MAGVRVKQTSGVPGAGFSVEVRGTGSIGANTEPLYVVDGFPLEPSGQNNGGGFSNGNPLDNINPSDIESIQVLKDAAAAAKTGRQRARRIRSERGLHVRRSTPQRPDCAAVRDE